MDAAGASSSVVLYGMPVLSKVDPNLPGILLPLFCLLTFGMTFLELG